MRISAEQATAQVKQASRIGEFAECNHAVVHGQDEQYGSLKRALKSIFADLFDDPDLALIEAFWDSEAALQAHLRHEAEFLPKIVFPKMAIVAPAVQLRPSYGKPRFQTDFPESTCTSLARDPEAPIYLDSITCADANLIRVLCLKRRWSRKYFSFRTSDC